MKNAKKYICFLVLGCVLCSNAYNVYQTCFASELVVAGGLASGGTALLGLLAMAGVGMELENNRKFNELSDEEKTRLENGLAQNYEDVALQRGASLEKIKTWTNDLCSGVLDKASECWGIFKDWAKSINLSYSSDNAESPTPYQKIDKNILLGKQCGDFIITQDQLSHLPDAYFYATIDGTNSIYCYYSTVANGAYFTSGTSVSIYQFTSDGGWIRRSTGNLTPVNTAILNGNINFIYSSVPFYATRDGNIDFDTDYAVTNFGASNSFSTNTDYLEKLKGQEEDVIDVIDVTDIKNPIIESRGNNIANIDWNKGTRRTNNNNDDDDKISTALVPMDVWYEAIDDEQEEMHNAIVSYNNYIEQHPEEQGKYFISTQPITNINNYYNTLPVVNLPAQGTVVNNYYEYNNYNNNNVTIYELPYNTELVPLLPKMIFENKFPFCIPFDIYQFFAMFYVEKEAPKITVPVPFKNEYGVFAEELVIDLSEYNYLSDVLRVMSFLMFIVGLMFVTRKLIKG